MQLTIGKPFEDSRRQLDSKDFGDVLGECRVCRARQNL
jgi:hypothetical protein